MRYLLTLIALLVSVNSYGADWIFNGPAGHKDYIAQPGTGGPVSGNVFKSYTSAHTVQMARSVQVLYNNAVPVSIYDVPGWIASPLTEHVLRSYTMPGGTMGANSTIRIIPLWGGPLSVNNKVYKVKFGSTAYYNMTLPSIASLQPQTKISNRNNLASQVGFSQYIAPGLGGSSNPNIYSNMDVASEVVINIANATTLETAKTLASTSNISGNGTTATVTLVAHGYLSGEYILTTLSSTAGYNVGPVMVTRVSADVFTYPCTGTGTPTTAPSFQRYSNIVSEAMTIELIP